MESSTFNWDHYQRTSFTDEGITSGAGTRTEGDNCSTSASCETFESTGSASQDETEENSTLADDDVYVEYSDEIATDMAGDTASTKALATSSGTSELSVATSEHTSSHDQNPRNSSSPQERSYLTEKPSRVLEENSTTPKSSLVNSPNSIGKASSANTVDALLPWNTRNLQESSIASNPRKPDPSPVALNTYNVTPRPSRVTTPTKHPTVPRSTTTVPTSSPKDLSSTPSKPRISERISHQPVFTKPIVLEHIPVVSMETEDGRNMVRKHQQQLRVLSVGLIIGIIAAILLLAVLLALAVYTARVLMSRFRRRPRPSLANTEASTILTKAPVPNGPNGSGHPGDDAAPGVKTTDQSEKAKPRDVVEWYV